MVTTKLSDLPVCHFAEHGFSGPTIHRAGQEPTVPRTQLYAALERHKLKGWELSYLHGASATLRWYSTATGDITMTITHADRSQDFGSSFTQPAEPVYLEVWSQRHFSGLNEQVLGRKGMHRHFATPKQALDFLARRLEIIGGTAMRDDNFTTAWDESPEALTKSNPERWLRFPVRFHP